jgi:hypothetical protein
VVRYEDLILDPEPALAALLGYVGVDAGPGTIRAMLDELGVEIPELREHPTSSSAGSSIGRWRTELSPELSAACEQAFGPVLDLFGYQRA